MSWYNNCKHSVTKWFQPMSILPINLDDLINARSVESVRREFKGTWSAPILEQTVRTISAFANDFFNLNGGYLQSEIKENFSIDTFDRTQGNPNLIVVKSSAASNCM